MKAFTILASALPLVAIAVQFTPGHIDTDVDLISDSDDLPKPELFFEEDDTSPVTISPLEKRADYDGMPVCYQELRNINHIAHFNTAAGRLREWNKRFWLDGKMCRRIACEKSAGIFMCNHNKYQISRHTQTIFDYYVRIAEAPRHCILWGSQLAGRQKSQAGWSVLAVKTNCGDNAFLSDSSWPN